MFFLSLLYNIIDIVGGKENEEEISEEWKGMEGDANYHIFQFPYFP